MTHFSEKYNILTCARRLSSLEETKAQACRPERVFTVEADISDETDRARFVTSLPQELRWFCWFKTRQSVTLLV